MTTDLSNAAKLVYLILDDLGESTAGEIAHEPLAPPRRTVNRALRELHEGGYIERSERPLSPTYRTARHIGVTPEVEG